MAFLRALVNYKTLELARWQKHFYVMTRVHAPLAQHMQRKTQTKEKKEAPVVWQEKNQFTPKDATLLSNWA